MYKKNIFIILRIHLYYSWDVSKEYIIRRSIKAYMLCVNYLKCYNLGIKKREKRIYENWKKNTRKYQKCTFLLYILWYNVFFLLYSALKPDFYNFCNIYY